MQALLRFFAILQADLRERIRGPRFWVMLAIVMVAAWWCDGEASANGGRLIDLPLMRDVRAYNEVDCRVMAEAIGYFRQHH